MKSRNILALCVVAALVLPGFKLEQKPNDAEQNSAEEQETQDLPLVEEPDGERRFVKRHPTEVAPPQPERGDVAAPAQAVQSAQTDAYGPALSTAEPSVESQYVYLATIAHLVEGASEDFAQTLRDIGATALKAPVAQASVEGLDKKLNDPLMLQADPASIVAQASQVIDLGLARREDIAKALADLEAERPYLADEPLQLAILENGVRFRLALSQALYALELREFPRSVQDSIDTYSEGTVGLRNGMELMQFDIALTEVTDDAIAQQRAAYAALQRGILAEIDPYSFTEDAKRARTMSDQAREGISRGLRGMYLQLLILAAVLAQ